MQFDSLEFFVFFIFVFILYWTVARKSQKAQNLLLLISSYFFYAWWDYRFLFLLIFSTGLDFITGSKIALASGAKRKMWLVLSVVINLSFLGFFKYYNFFVGSLSDSLNSIGLHPSLWTLSIILPVGISFYTFHGLSYVFDIYYRRIEPTGSYVDYAVFVSFFPLLVAGPIERATHLLPQVKSTRVFSSAKSVDGLRQILWGLFKKVVIADNCAAIANLIFNNQQEYTGPILVMGAVFFAFQIYGDFSGYSDIALGTARLLGFDLVRNFAFPYFSRSIAEFWRRWHISLSSWFRDYLYMPLGGSRGTSYIRVRNVLVIFLVSGLWHGANWTFLIWGALNALYILPSLLAHSKRKQTEIVAQGRLVPSWREASAMILTFSLTTFAWIFFRSVDVSHALSYVQRMVMGMFQISSYFDAYQFALTKVGIMIPFFVVVFLVIEWLGREQPFALAKISLQWPLAARWSFYYSLIFFLLLFGGKEQQFIYFQF